MRNRRRREQPSGALAWWVIALIVSLGLLVAAARILV
jgi:hypothetical protein